MPGENLDAVVNENKGETKGTGLETLELGNGGKSVLSCWNWYLSIFTSSVALNQM